MDEADAFLDRLEGVADEKTSLAAPEASSEKRRKGTRIVSCVAKILFRRYHRNKIRKWLTVNQIYSKNCQC